MEENVNVTELFGCDVFNDAVMEERLPKKVYKELKETIEEGKELSLEIADVVAHEMKEWAIEKGATHFSHWFQPMTLQAGSFVFQPHSVRTLARHSIRRHHCFVRWRQLISRHSVS